MSELLSMELLRALCSILFLTFSSYQDIRKREIDDTVWKAFLIAALVLNLLDLLAGNVDLVGWLLLGMAQSLIFSALYYLNAFGGADAKSLICLSFMYPTTIGGLAENLSKGRLSAGISTFNNAMILALIYLPANLIRNIALQLQGVNLFEGLENENPIKRAAALLLLRKIRVSDFSKNRHKFLLAEDLGQDKKRRISLSRNINEETVPEGLLEGESEYLFASPLMPLQVFIAVGLILYLIFGDLFISSSIYLARNLLQAGH